MGSARCVACGLVLVLLTSAVSARGSESPLADAAERRDRPEVRTLLTRGEAVNRAQADGMTALHWAAYHDDLEMARLLVGAKADARAANRYGITPLTLACTNGDGPMVALLLDA